MCPRHSATFSFRQFLTIIVFLLTISSQLAFPADRAVPVIGILYPQSTSATKPIYDDIRDSVARGLKSRGYRFVEKIIPQPPLADPEALRDWAARNRVVVAISLGRLAYDKARALKPAIPVISGAVTLDQSADASGISLTPNPRLMFTNLKELAPSISRVLVVTDAGRNTQLLKVAQEVAATAQLEISQFSASDIREATQHYYNIFRYSNPKTDAIWITDDAFVDTDVTLPKIMENSWAKNFVVISNVLDHVSRGALLATFLDPNGLGDRLAQLAADAASGKTVGQSLGEDLKLAVNVRVASHLGLQLNERSRSRYGLVVGER